MKYRIVNQVQIEKRAQNAQDPRSVYHQALLDSSTYEGYLAKVGSDTPVYPPTYSGGRTPISAVQEYRYMRDKNQWIVEVDDQGVDQPPIKPSDARRDWSADEVRRTVEAYFAMLELELAHQPYEKSRRNDDLRVYLNSRNKAAVEMKHQNISAVLDDMGLPWINGYKPRQNAQGLLRDTVIGYLDRFPDAFDKAAPTEVVQEPLDSIFVDSPPGKATERAARERKAVKIDFAQRDARSRNLGVAGEQFVFNAHRSELELAGRADLAAKVRWVARDEGDGLGYDIEGFLPDGAKLFIEVKATNGGISAPFVVTANEVRASEELRDGYAIYRVFDLARSPKIYMLRGRISDTCFLEPILFRARVSS